jgi:hypothetical protein
MKGSPSPHIRRRGHSLGLFTSCTAETRTTTKLPTVPSEVKDRHNFSDDEEHEVTRKSIIQQLGNVYDLA